MTPTTKYSGTLPHWIGDRESLAFYPAGAPVDFDAFTDAKYGAAGKRRIPSGTVVTITAGKIVPGAGAANETYLLFADVAEDNRALNASNLHGVVVGGVVREAYLPDAAGTSLPAALKTALGARFVMGQ